MAERSVFIKSGDLRLEALVDHSPGDRAVVVAHPHPLYGGEMHNNVVQVIVDAYRGKGFSTLRFNFRGVGGSEGAYDEGIGEQEDVQSALSFMDSLGKKQIDLAGYSFGARVSAQGVGRFQLARRLIMVSPPVSAMDFGFLQPNPKIRLVVTGSQDDIADPATIRNLIPGWGPGAFLKIIPDADHFYWGKTGELQAVISEFLDQEV